MLGDILDFFRARETPERGSGADGGERELRVAACALLLELAWADDEFSDEERAHLTGAVRRHFGLDAEEVERLLREAEAERGQAVDLWGFARQLDRHYSEGQKMVLAEIMWGVIYADGRLARREDHLVRRISNLLRITPGYLGEARRRAAEDEDDGRP